MSELPSSFPPGSSGVGHPAQNEPPVLNVNGMAANFVQAVPTQKAVEKFKTGSDSFKIGMMGLGIGIIATALLGMTPVGWVLLGVGAAIALVGLAAMLYHYQVARQQDPSISLGKEVAKGIIAGGVGAGLTVASPFAGSAVLIAYTLYKGLTNRDK